MNIEDIWNWLEQTGTTQAELARRIGIETTALNKALHKKRRLQHEEAERLRAIIESRQSQLIVIDNPPRERLPKKEEKSTTPNSIVERPRDLPVFGGGLPDDNGAVNMGIKPSEYIRRPSVLDNVENGYAFWVHDDTMRPRYDLGEVVYIHPDRPTPPGSWVVVKLRNSTPNAGSRILIRRLVTISPKIVVVEQLNPAKQTTFDRAQVLDIDRIVQSGER